MLKRNLFRLQLRRVWGDTGLKFSRSTLALNMPGLAIIKHREVTGHILRVGSGYMELTPAIVYNMLDRTLTFIMHTLHHRACHDSTAARPD